MSEDLGELDHVRIVVELFGKVDHLICAVLLSTWISCCQKCPDRVYSDGIALSGATGFVLRKEKKTKKKNNKLQAVRESVWKSGKRTHAASH